MFLITIIYSQLFKLISSLENGKYVILSSILKLSGRTAAQVEQLLFQDVVYGSVRRLPSYKAKWLCPYIYQSIYDPLVSFKFNQ